MKRRFITYVQQIAPTKDETFWMEVMRTKLGTSGYGQRKAWVKLPADQPGWKAKPGFGKLFFDYLMPTIFAETPGHGDGVNREATALLNQPDTVWSPPSSESRDFSVLGYAWLAPDEGHARPYFTLRAEHESEVRRHVIDTDEMAFDVHAQGRTLYVFPAYANGKDAAEWMRKMSEDPGLDDEDKPSPEEIAEYAAAYDAFPTLARMRWA